jgi:hypothetical protein
VRYEFFELPPIAGLGASAGLGINNDRDAVGWSAADASGVSKRATLWRFCHPGSLRPYSGPVDLALLAGIPVGAPRNSEAREINEAEVAVGFRQVEVNGTFLNRAFVWDMPDAIYTEVTPFGPGSSEAWGINDEANPGVVGWGEATGFCSGPAGSVYTQGFRLVWTNGIGALSPLPANVSGYLSRAHDLATATPSRVVGLQTNCESLPPCAPQNDAVRWTGVAPPSVTQLFELGVDNGSIAWATNEAGMSAGSIDAQAACVTHAAFWATPSSATDLSAASGVPAFLRTEARGISEPNGVQRVLVVGSELSNQRAVLWTGIWTGSAYAWSYQYLDEAVSLVWNGIIIDALDVTDDGWIVGKATAANGGTVGVVLRPVVNSLFCPGDVDRSGTVDAADLTLLLAAWGSSSTPSYLADINVDDAINASDLTLLLAAWGTQCPSCPVGDGVAGAQMQDQDGAVDGAVPAELSVALAGVGFADVNEFVAWGLAATDPALADVAAALSVVINAVEGD